MVGLETFIIPALTALGASAQTAGTVGTIANVAAVGAGAASTYAGYQGQVASNKMQAEDARRRGIQEIAIAQTKAAEERRKKEKLISQQRAQFGASGGGLGGSAAEVIGETELQGNYNSELELWQGQERANGYEDQARAALFENKQAKAALPFKLGSQIIKGGIDIAKSFPVAGSDSVILGTDYDPNSGWETTTRRNSPYRYA